MDHTFRPIGQDEQKARKGKYEIIE